MSAGYAAKTTVPVARSQEEIKTLLKKHGASEIAVFEGAQRAFVAFKLVAFFYRLSIEAPAKPSEQEERRLWRCLGLLIKAKLVAVADGVSTVEREFFADMMTEGGATTYERAMPQLIEAREAGRMPASLLLEGPH